MNKTEGLLLNRIDSVYDADTFRATVNGWPKWLENCPFRLHGVDTPEIGWRAKSPRESDLANKAREYVVNTLREAKKITVDIKGRGKYFRVLVVVYVDGVDLNQSLINLGFAVNYDGGVKPTWES